ncbi:hypothetical protein EDD11_000936, partial [Mortierella claussenii]
MIMYIELADAIKAGDIGRIEEVLKWITIIFQAGSTKNYGNELLRLHCEMQYAWDTEAKRAIMSSWLINTSGDKGRWIPADLYQEHNNLLTKVIHAAKGSNASWEMLAEAISTNIYTFSRIAFQLETQYNIPKNKSWHADVSYEADIERILTSLREHKILDLACQLQVQPVKDLIHDGTMNLNGGRIETFLNNNGGLACGAGAEAEQKDPEDDNLDLEQHG